MFSLFEEVELLLLSRVNRSFTLDFSLTKPSENDVSCDTDGEPGDPEYDGRSLNMEEPWCELGYDGVVLVTGDFSEYCSSLERCLMLCVEVFELERQMALPFRLPTQTLSGAHL